MKIDGSTILVVILGAIILGSSGMLAGLRGVGTELNFDWLIGGDTLSNTVPVNRQLDFALTNEYAGSALGTKTLLVFDSDGETQKESLTTAADGTINTAFSYPSGKQIYVYYESSNDKQWFDIIVPEMNENDVESSTYNVIPLESFAIGTYSTDALKLANGTSVADAGTWNITLNDATPKWTYSLANTGNDNTGIKASYDPTYKMNFDVVFYMTLSGTGYESVLVYGASNAFTLGATQYYTQTLDPYALTKEKDGWQYKSHGTQDVGFWMDLSGITTGDSVTWQIYVYGYSDPSWCQNHGGDYGHEKVELAEHTITIEP